jgi:hypothetical protein
MRGRGDLVGSPQPSDEPPNRKRPRHGCVWFGLYRLMELLLESHRSAPDHCRSVSRGFTGLSVKFLGGARGLIRHAFSLALCVTCGSSKSFFDLAAKVFGRAFYAIFMVFSSRLLHINPSGEF